MQNKRTTRSLALLAIGVGLAINGHAQSFLTNGLVAYYPFNGNANDASGNGHNGTVYGGVTLTAGRFGNPNAAYNFDGSTGYIDVPQNAALNALTTNVTLSAWIWQRGAILGGYSILSKSETKVGNGWMFDTYNCDGITPGHRLRLQTGGNNNSCNVAGSTQYSLMQWHHVVATISGTTGKVYLDGTLDGSGDVGALAPNALDVFIGYTHVTEGAGATSWFNGAIDDIRIYNRALSDAEVQQLYEYESGPRVKFVKAFTVDAYNLSVGSNYILEASSDLTNWTTIDDGITSSTGTYTNTTYWRVDDWNKLFFRLQAVP